MGYYFGYVNIPRYTTVKYPNLKTEAGSMEYASTRLETYLNSGSA